MFRLLRLNSMRGLRAPLRTPISTPLNTNFRNGIRRTYATTEQPPKDPKIRVFVAIALVVTGIFAVGVRQKKGTARPNEVTEDLSDKKAQPKTQTPPAAFTPDQVFVVFVLGGPGSGKGTQCANIVRDYNFAHLSAGDLLRAEQQREGSEYGELIANYIKSGQIVPQEITIALLKNAMDAERKKGTNHFLIDGFPRKMDQALTFEQTVVPSKFTLFFECPEQTMLERLLKRGETSGRSDDNIESIKKRFKVFVGDSMPVVNYFDLVGKVARLQCTDTPDKVYENVEKVLDAHGVKRK